MPSDDVIPFGQVGAKKPPQTQLPTSVGDVIPFNAVKPKFQAATPKIGDEIRQREAEGESEFNAGIRRFAMPVAGGIGGFLAAGPPGAVVGATTAGLVNDVADKGSPLTPGEALGSTALNAGTQLVGGRMLQALPVMKPLQERLAHAFMNTILQTGIREGSEEFSGQEQPPFDLGTKAIDFGKDFGLNLGFDVGMRGVAKGAHRLVNGKVVSEPGVPLGEELARTREQIGPVGPSQQTGVPAQSRTTYGQQGQARVRGKLAESEATEKALFDNFRKQHVGKNVETLDIVTGYDTQTDPGGNTIQVPRTRPRKIEGPIYTANTAKLAGEPLKQLDAFMKGEDFESLPPEMKTKYSEVRQALRKLVTGQKIVYQGQEINMPILEWETAKEIRTQIAAGAGGKATRNFSDELLTKIAKSLGDDINFSVGTGWRNGPQAMRALEMANSATELQKQTFNKEIKSKLYGRHEYGSLDPRTDGNPEDFFKAGYNSRSKFQRTREALGEENAYVQSRDYFDNYLMRKAFGPNMNKFNPDTIINELEDVNSSSRDAFNAGERNNILRFARAAKASMSDTEASSNRTMSILKDRAILVLTGGAARIAGVPSAGAAVRVAIGAKELLNEIKDNKQLSDIAQRLIKINPNTAEAQAGSKLLLKALGGTTLQVMAEKDRAEE